MKYVCARAFGIERRYREHERYITVHKPCYHRSVLVHVVAAAGSPTLKVRFRGESIRAKILIIDDEPLVVAALRRVLGREYDVAGETSGRVALARLQSGETFDLVLCDLMMPDMTGMDVHRHLSTAHPATAARMVFMTGAPITKRAMEFIDSGVRCFQKPFDIPRFRKTIELLVRRQ